MRFTLPGVPSITSRCGPSSAADRATGSPVETSSSEDESTNVEVRWRPEDGDEVAGSFHEFDANLLKSSVPWRVFRWRKGQRHYSGSYWSSTMDAHIIYESRLELSRLIFADFDLDAGPPADGQGPRPAGCVPGVDGDGDIRAG
jgi:hypothetical protein